MLRFRRYIQLWEGRIEFLKRTSGDINSSHDTTGKYRSSSDIIDHFAERSDPSANKQYTQWIINKYKTRINRDGSTIPGQFRQEDHSRIRTALEGFDTYKELLPHKDINRYQSIHDLESALEPHLGTKKKIINESTKKVSEIRGSR